MTDVWEEKPEPVWIPRGYYSTSKIKEDDIQMIIIDDMDAWLKKLKKFYHDWIADQKTELDGLRAKAEKYDKIIDLTNTEYHNYPVENLAELILKISDGIEIQDSSHKAS